MISKERYLNLSNWLIIAFLSLLPFQPQEVQVNSILIIALSLLSVLSIRARDLSEFRIRSQFLWMPLLWIALVLSLLWSGDVDRGLNSVFKSLPLLLLPFVFSLQAKNSAKIKVWKQVFVASCLLASVIGLSSGLLKFAESGLSYHFSYQYVCAFFAARLHQFVHCPCLGNPNRSTPTKHLEQLVGAPEHLVFHDSSGRHFFPKRNCVASPFDWVEFDGLASK